MQSSHWPFHSSTEYPNRIESFDVYLYEKYRNMQKKFFNKSKLRVTPQKGFSHTFLSLKNMVLIISYIYEKNLVFVCLWRSICCYVYIDYNIIQHMSCKVLRIIYHSVCITLLWWYDVNVEPICVYLTMIMAGKHISNNKANTALREKKLLLYFPMLSITRYTSSFSFKSLLCKSLKHQRCGSIYLKGLC